MYRTRRAQWKRSLPFDVAATCVAAAFAVSPGLAGWEQMTGPLGPSVTDLAEHGAVVIMGTNEADAGDIYRSVDEGRTWVNARLPNGGILVTLSHGDAIFVGGYLTGLYRSLDDGLTWEHLTNGLSPSVSVSALTAVDASTLIAGFDLPPAQLYRSTDGGDTWSLLASSPSLRCHDLAVAAGVLLAAAEDVGVPRSTDGGNTWLPTGAGLPAGADVDRLAASGSLVYAGVRTSFNSVAVYRSADAGATWMLRSVDLPTGNSIRFGTLFLSGSILYAGLDSRTTGNGLYRSTDGGVHWEHVSAGLPPVAAEQVTAGTEIAGDLVIGTPNGLYRSSDGGETWQESWLGSAAIETVPAVLATDGLLLVGVQRGGSLGQGVWRTSDQGLSWGSATGVNTNTTALDFLVLGEEILATFQGLARGVYRSSDGGASFTASSSGLSMSVLHRCLHAHPGVVLVGTNEQTYRSTDAGHTWNPVPALTNVSAFETMAEDILAGRYGEGVMISSDGGLTWLPFSEGLDNDQARRINDLALWNGQLYAATNGDGVYRLAGDNTWQQVGLDGAFVLDLYAVSEILAAAASFPSTVFISDDGEQWSEFSDGYIGSEVHVLASDSSHLILGARGSGLWLRPLSELPQSTAAPEEGGANGRVAAIFAPGPNPVQNRAWLDMTLAGDAPVSVRVYDLRGRMVAAPVDGWYPAGSHRAELDTSRLPAGVYVYRVEASGHRETGRWVIVR